jgi:hypothetical protein
MDEGTATSNQPATNPIVDNQHIRQAILGKSGLKWLISPNMRAPAHPWYGASAHQIPSTDSRFVHTV